MAHHQGMALVAIGNVLNGAAMSTGSTPTDRRSDGAAPQERMPRDVLVARPRAEERRAPPTSATSSRRPSVGSPRPRCDPRTHLLSNGRYAVMMTAAGSGYSRWGDIAVTRWREDATRDSWGSYLFVRDAESGAVWSAGHQPSGTEADRYEVTYSEDHVELARRDGSIATGLNVVVSAEHDA
jgi:cyclic beta-1,2-glucan synthetase